MHRVGDLWIGTCSRRPWLTAVDAFRADTLAPDGDDGEHWGAAGMFEPDGSVREGWRLAFETVTRQRAGGLILARYRDTIFQTHLTATRSQALTVVTRGLVHAGNDVVRGMLPSVEVATAPLGELWTLLRRVLPPVAKLRAAPSEAPARDLTVELPGDWPDAPSPQQVVQWVTGQLAAHPTLARVQQPCAEVSTVLGRGERGSGRQSVWLTDGTVVVRATPDGLAEVPAGGLARWHLDEAGRLLNGAT